MPSQETKALPSMDRKVKKPLMEKRRRARINQCLSELKTMLLEAYSSSPQNQQRTSKLEKADILEMTVQYFRNRSSISANNESRSASAARAFVDGYSQCAQTALQFVPPSDRGAFMAHLTVSLNTHLKHADDRSSSLTLSIPHNICGSLNQASQPTPPLTMSILPYPNLESAGHIPISSSLISPVSSSASDRDSPCDSTYSCSSNGGSTSSSYSLAMRQESGLLTPVTPSFVNGRNGGKVWRPW